MDPTGSGWVAGVSYELGLALSHPGEVAGEEDCQTRHLWILECVVLPAQSNSLAPHAGGGHRGEGPL